MLNKIMIPFFKILFYNAIVTGSVCFVLHLHHIVLPIQGILYILAITIISSIYITYTKAIPLQLLLHTIKTIVDTKHKTYSISLKETAIKLSHLLEQFKMKSDAVMKEKDTIVHELTESKKLLEKYSTNLEEMVEQRTEILKWLSITDPLTGLYNRRYFIEQIELEFKRSKRYSRDLSLLMLDIDHFKLVNDNYGHQIGDIVLRKISSVIINLLRDSDLAFRYGGEEFMIILPETKSEDAINVAERMKQEIMNTQHNYSSINFTVTASFGIVSIKDMIDKFETIDDIIKKVDDNLYKAKNSGRNTIIYE
ncbi:MAG TPA: GGDEF domain-containing protein [Spirochaetota bacterium]|nr:GGDEF domain-containing protein [Spirochaetota bacterium]HQG42541.1 GGDEF domain-containing protein [Spirochaetota bacterium]HQK08337.1 GGDEF domain-containing protein [Spirochaetota bacterium]